VNVDPELLKGKYGLPAQFFLSPPSIAYAGKQRFDVHRRDDIL